MRGLPAMLLLAVALAGCGASGSREAAFTERCVDRLLAPAERDPRVSEETLRRYARDTYCARFARQGWVYDDGALRIDAHRWLVEGGECETEVAGERAQTVPCEELSPAGPRVLDCALLRHVRRSEVRAYIEELGPEREVDCGDGTPLDELGVP